MAKLVYTDNAASTLGANISGGATSFTVQVGDASEFPSPTGGDFCYIRIGDNTNNEVVKVTARSGNTLTCVATSNAWSSGDEVKLTMNSQVLDQLVKDGGVGTDVELKDYAETSTSPSSSSATLVLNIENGNVFDVTLTEAVTTLTLSNPSATGKACGFTLILTQGGAGGWVVTWPASVQWAGGTAPTLTTTAAAVCILTFFTTDGGTTWWGGLMGDNFS